MDLNIKIKNILGYQEIPVLLKPTMPVLEMEPGTFG